MRLMGRVVSEAAAKGLLPDLPKLTAPALVPAEIVESPYVFSYQL